MELQTQIGLALAAYLLWFAGSHRYTRRSDRVLQPLWPIFTFLLRALGPLLGVKYRLVLDRSYAVGKRCGWPYYNDTVEKMPKSIICWHPHSALTVLPFTFTQSSEVFGSDVFMAVASVLFKIPVLREILLCGNCRDASDAVLDSLLEQGKTVMIQPGGVYEQVRFSDNHEVAYFNPNLGFLRKAVRYGAPLVPSYSFGENQLYRSRPDRVWISSLLTRLGVPTPAASGKFGTPAGLLCLPGKPVYVLGAPIRVTRADRSEEEAAVRHLFGEYLGALRAIWKEHSGLLPKAVAEKGLRCVYRCKGGGEVASDSQETDCLLVDAFAAAYCKP